MYFLKIIGLLALSAGIVWGTHRRLMRKGFAKAWHVTFGVLTIIGMEVGFWFTSIRSMPSPTEQVWGFPFTIAGGEFFEGSWHNGGVGRFLYFALAADVMCAMALCTAPLTFVSLMVRRNSG